MTGVPATAPVRPVATGSSTRQRAVRTLLIALLALLAGIGIALLAGLPREHQRLNDYVNASVCPALETATPCFTLRPVTLTGVRTDHTALGSFRRLVVVDVDGEQATLEVLPSLALACATPGDRVGLKTFEGDLTAVVTPRGVIPTLANPTVYGSARLQGAVSVLCVALIVPLGVVVARRRQARTGQLARLRTLVADLPLRAGLVAFGLGQLADVVTSALGQYSGLVEGNAVVALFVHSTGLAGFLLFRLPAIALFLLGLAQIPRRLLITALWGCAVIFLLIGAHNADLLLTNASVVPSCA